MKKKIALALAFASIMAVMVVSCNKQSSDNRQMVTASAPSDVRQLAARFTQPLDDSYDALAKAYSSLSMPDLKNFWLEVTRINLNVTSLTVAQQEKVTSQLETNNQVSLSKFGKPYNQLNAVQIREVFSPNEVTGKMPPPSDPPPCALYSYPLQFWPGNEDPSPPANFYTIVANYFEGDCEGIEYSYSGIFYSSMRAITALGQQVMINGYGNPWPWRARKANGYSIVWAPTQFITTWFGTYAGFNNHVRVGKTQILID